MTTNCCNFISNFLTDYFQFGMHAEQAYYQIENQHTPDQSTHWDQAAETPLSAPSSLTNAVAHFPSERRSSLHVLVFGHTHSFAALCLLKEGFHVTAVDPSNNALTNLRETWSKSVYINQNSKLKTVQSPLENYSFDKKFDLILMHDSLPYCDPRQFKEIWNRAHEALKTEGMLVGNFRLRSYIESEEAWSVSQPCADALLKDKNYELEEMRVENHLLQFIVRKV